MCGTPENSEMQTFQLKALASDGLRNQLTPAD